jgi:nucleoside-diphosphate-sugar epimerase
MNALVTGSNGYIGKNLADYLLHEGILPRNYDIVNHPDQSVCNMEYLNRWVYGIKGVYHLAALPGIKACEDDPDTALNTNVIGTWTVGLVCMSKDIPFIMASSFAVNGGHGVYADTKYLAEKFALRYGGRVCRISNVFGGEDIRRRKIL